MIPQKPSSPERVTLAVLAVAADDPVTVRTERPTLLMPVESSVVRVEDKRRGRQQPASLLDRSGFLLLPSAARVALLASTPAARVMALGFHASVLDDVEHAYRKLGLERARFEQWLAVSALLPRTVWVHEIVHRYMFERHALGENDNDTTRFLETEIAKELYYLFRDRDEGVDRATIQHKHSGTVERAVAYVEAHLFDPCRVASLARHAGASESTLLRLFRKELGCTPATYWRQRKQDEALLLLRSGRYSVAEIAERVGYDNATAFAHAFRMRFGRPPSSFRPRTPLKPAPG